MISKVKTVQGAGTWNGKDGTLFYKYDYTFVDGGSITASHKTEMPFKQGDDVEYEVTHPQNNYGKVKKPSNFNNSKPDLKGIKVGHAINNAVILHSSVGQMPNTNGVKDSIKAYSKLIYQISMELENEL